MNTEEIPSRVVVCWGDTGFDPPAVLKTSFNKTNLQQCFLLMPSMLM